MRWARKPVSRRGPAPLLESVNRLQVSARTALWSARSSGARAPPVRRVRQLKGEHGGYPYVGLFLTKDPNLEVPPP